MTKITNCWTTTDKKDTGDYQKRYPKFKDREDTTKQRKWKSLSVKLYVTPQAIYSPWNSLGPNTGVGSLSLLRGIFPTQGLNSGLLHSRSILYQLSHQGRPRTLEWVAYPFSRGSFWPRNWTRVSCIEGGFFTNWAAREANNYTTFVLSQKWKFWAWHEVPQIGVTGGGAPRGTSPFHHEGCINP